jgi:uncharacterized membrane protein
VNQGSSWLDRGGRRKLRGLVGDQAARLRNYFVAGIIVTVPLVVTIWVFNRFVLQLDGVLHWVPSSWIISGISIKELLQTIPGLGAVTTLVFVVIVGFLTTNLVGRRVVRATEKLIQRVPILSTIYQGVKQLVEALASSDMSRFSEVVYLEYPRRGIWSIGFVTGDTYEGSRDLLRDRLLNVFVPTTPNPTSGFYLLVPAEDVVRAGITIEEAFKLIMSAGIVSPGGETRGTEVDLTAPTEYVAGEEPEGEV